MHAINAKIDEEMNSICFRRPYRREPGESQAVCSTPAFLTSSRIPSTAVTPSEAGVELASPTFVGLDWRAVSAPVQWRDTMSAIHERGRGKHCPSDLRLTPVGMRTRSESSYHENARGVPRRRYLVHTPQHSTWNSSCTLHERYSSPA